MTKEPAIQSRCAEEDIDLVRLLFVTQSGAVRAQTVDTAKLDEAIENGTTVSQLIQMYNAVGRRNKDGHLTTVGEVRLRPDPDTFRALPYAERTGVMFCNIQTLGGNPWTIDARSSLRSFSRTLESKGLSPRVSFESEFHLFERNPEGGDQTIGSPGAYLTESTRETHGTILRAIDALEEQDVVVEKYHPEYAPGKHEIVTGHQFGLRAADEHVLVRETVDSVARSDGYRATFLPRPFDNATNGCHLHVSLWDGETNQFYDSGEGSLSRIGKQFIAGVLEHAPALTALAAPTANSYARLRPQNGAAGYVCWGQENREALVRVPALTAGDQSGNSLRLEFRGADNAVNPYLCLLGLLGAGYDGVDRGLDVPEPLSVDPGNLTAEERSKKCVERLPRTLGQALDELESDDVLRDVLGDALFETYIQVKRSHWREFAYDSAQSWEMEHLRSVY
ncbi:MULTISPECIES: gamma-glutamylputrescine synthetase [unclassified Haloarcula]|uniref:gamma-glutamylputrescine synthetase n=1 Tax=unclassified Haloarcula TaxID=2624677 RepID=UPI00300EF18C